jgi:hypothetical protein
LVSSSLTFDVTSEDQLIAAAHRILDKISRKPAAERFANMVQMGMVNQEGQLTMRYGGAARAEAGCLDEAAALFANPLDRMIWVLCRWDWVCIDGSTARRLSGASSLEGLVRLIDEAVAMGLVERWSKAGTPAPLDPVGDENKDVGMKLTERGRAHAQKLEVQRGNSLPLEA